MALSGHAIRIELPEREPVAHGRLLDVIPMLPTGPDEPGDELSIQQGSQGVPLRWLQGVVWQPEADRGVSLQDADCAPSNNTEHPPTCDPAVEQPAFTIMDALRGSTLEWTADDLDEYLSDRVNIQTSTAFGRELLGAVGSGGMSLSNSATAPGGLAFGSAATPIWNALAVLEDELAARLRGAKGIIHIPPGLLAQCAMWGVLHLVDGQYLTPLGHLVVADAGYANSVAPDGQSASGTGQDWVYASGPVFYLISDSQFLGDGWQSTDISRNQITRWLATYGLLVFDPAPVTAVLVSYNVDPV